MFLILLQGKGPAQDRLSLIVFNMCIGTGLPLDHPGHILVHINPVYHAKIALPQGHHQIIIVDPRFKFRRNRPNPENCIQSKGSQLHLFCSPVITFRVKHPHMPILQGKIEYFTWLQYASFLPVRYQCIGSRGTIDYRLRDQLVLI